MLRKLLSGDQYVKFDWGLLAMKHVIVLIKPASSLCDIRCTYCFYFDVAKSRHEFSSGIMTKQTVNSLLQNVFCDLEMGDNITFAFQGGEPGLAGIDFFAYFVDEAKKAAAKKVKIHYTFQTNGLMIDEIWCGFFRENNFLVGLSLDGFAALHNKNRLDSHGKGTYARVMAAKKLMDKHLVAYNILCVLTAESSRRAARIWDFIIQENIRFIQFIPCLSPLKQHSAYALSGEKFYRFYSDLFLRWKSEASRGNIFAVRFFEDIGQFYLKGRAVTCGFSGRCSPQIVVEADGGVYPCDFYVLDDYKVGNLTKDTLREVFEAVVRSGFLKDSPMPDRCRECTYSKWCHGGCKRMRHAVYGERCGMRMFLDENLHELLSVFSRISA